MRLEDEAGRHNRLQQLVVEGCGFEGGEVVVQPHALQWCGIQLGSL